MSPLPKFPVPLDFTQGVDSKSDDKLGAKPTTLENGIFGEKKSLTRRPGHSLVANIASSIGTDGLLCSRSGQVLARDRDRLRGRASDGSIIDYGYAYQFIASKRRLMRKNSTRTAQGQAVVSGIVGLAWYEANADKSYFTTMDDSSGLPLMPSHVDLGTATYGAVVLAASDRLCCIYGDGTNIKMTYALVATPTTTSTVTLRTDAGTSGVLKCSDAVMLPSGNIAVAYTSSAGGIRLVIVNTAGTLQSGPTSIAEVLVDPAFHINAFSGGNFAVFWNASTTAYRYAVYSSALASVQAAASFASGLGVVGGITSVADSSNNLYVFANAYPTTNIAVYSAVLASTGTISTALAVLARRAWIAAAPFIHNSRVYIPTTQTASNGNFYEQPTIQILERVSSTSLRVAAVLLRSLSAITTGLAGTGSANRYVAPRTRVKTDGTWPVILLPEKGRPALNAADTTVQGFAEFELKEDVAGYDVERTRLAPVEYGHNLYFPGSVLRQFDGRAIYEAGFLQFPGPISLAQSGAAGLANGTYEYVVVWEWIDAQGQLHRSAPSLPVSFTVTGGPRNVTVTIPSLTATEKSLTAVVYRTEASGTTFYRVNLPNAGSGGDVSNNTAADSFTYIDTATDATIAAREILYTTAELENTCPPASVFAHVHQKRLFLVCAEDENRLAYTDEQEEGYGPTFNDAYEIDCGPEQGGIIGVGSIDDKLILLRRTGLQYISGSGPDRLGLQNTFTTPQFITSDTGCVSAASIVQTPDGIMFKGERGLYLLNRGLQLVWIGEEVESFTGRVSCAQLVAKRTQVRFSCPEVSRVLAFDYSNQQWSIFTGLQFDGMAVVDSVLYALTRAEALWSESATAAGDNSTAFSMVVVTPWVKAAGVRGVQRVYRALLLGEIEGFSTVTLEIGYDYSDTYETTLSVDTSELGAVDEALSMRTHLSKQKCEAIRFRITCSGANGGAASLGAALSNLTLEVGGKRGARKLPATQTI